MIKTLQRQIERKGRQISTAVELIKELESEIGDIARKLAKLEAEEAIKESS